MCNSTDTLNGADNQSFTDNDKRVAKEWHVNLSGGEIDRLNELTGQISLFCSCLAYTGEDGVDLTEKATTSLLITLTRFEGLVSDLLKRAMQKEEVGHA